MQIHGSTRHPVSGEAQIAGFQPILPAGDEQIVVEPQELVHPAAVGLDRARGQASHFAGGFVLFQEFHALQFVAQELLSQFVR